MSHDARVAALEGDIIQLEKQLAEAEERKQACEPPVPGETEQERDERQTLFYKADRKCQFLKGELKAARYELRQHQAEMEAEAKRAAEEKKKARHAETERKLAEARRKQQEKSQAREKQREDEQEWER